MSANIHSLSFGSQHGNQTLDTIWGRRSIGRLVEPAPSQSELTALIEAGSIAPDHDRLRPFRFIILSGESLDAFGSILAERLEARLAAAGLSPTEGQLQKERTKLRRAPLVIVVAAKIDSSSRIPEIEQFAAAAAAAENILLAATSMGYGSMWRTGDISYDEKIKEEFGLSSADHIVGWLYIGTRTDNSLPVAVQVPDITDLASHWTP